LVAALADLHKELGADALGLGRAGRRVPQTHPLPAERVEPGVNDRVQRVPTAADRSALALLPADGSRVGHTQPSDLRNTAWHHYCRCSEGVGPRGIEPRTRGPKIESRNGRQRIVQVRPPRPVFMAAPLYPMMKFRSRRGCRPIIHSGWLRRWPPSRGDQPLARLAADEGLTAAIDTHTWFVDRLRLGTEAA